MVRQWIVTPSFAGSSPVVRPNIKVKSFLLPLDVFIINNVLPKPYFALILALKKVFSFLALYYKILYFH